MSSPVLGRIAVLMTCHDRRPLTLRCLASLRTAAANVAADLDVFLVDDGCTDGTAAAVAEQFPDVRIIPGSGSLYWCGGMRVAWRAAVDAGGYDSYLWLNDDVQLAPDSLAVLFETAAALVRERGRAGIVVGSTRDAEQGGTTYGEMGAAGVEAAGTAPRPIASFNGNIVLIADEVYRRVGGLSRLYTHGFGDLDYACRARRHGIPIWLAPGHLGTCSIGPRSRWERKELSLWRRLVALHRPTGCPPWELTWLMLRHGSWWFPVAVARLYWRVLFPRDWQAAAA